MIGHRTWKGQEGGGERSSLLGGFAEIPSVIDVPPSTLFGFGYADDDIVANQCNIQLVDDDKDKDKNYVVNFIGQGPDRVSRAYLSELLILLLRMQRVVVNILRKLILQKDRASQEDEDEEKQRC